MKKLRVIQIGIGHDHGPDTLRSLLKNDDVFEVAALAIPECEKERFEKHITKFSDVPHMSVEEALSLSEIDAAIIETEEENLTNYAQMAADKGINIHMDKPGGLELCDFEKLITTVKEKHLAFHTGYMYRYNHAIMDAVKKVKNGDLGKIYSVEAHMSCFHVPEKRQWLEKLPGGMMFFLGCHLIDLIFQIQGMPEEVIPLNTSTGIDAVTANDLGMVVLKYKDGVSFAKTCATETGGYARRQLVICGEKGTIEIKPLEVHNEGWAMFHSETRELYTHELVNWASIGEKKKGDIHNRYNDMMRSFAQIVRGEKENPWSYEYELELYKLVLKACGK